MSIRDCSGIVPVVNPPAPPGSPLGSNYKICVQTGEKRRHRNFRLQHEARDILPDHRVAQCMRSRVLLNHGVEVLHPGGDGSAHYGNLVQCNSVWACPICSDRITTKRREELSKAIVQARLKGLQPVLVSYTLRHSRQDALQDVLAALLDSCRAFKSGRPFQELAEEYAWQGSVKALEVTYGRHGWHPHVHELVFLAVELNEITAGGLRAWIAERWRHVVKRRGYDASWEHGVDVRLADQDIAEYIEKFGHEPQHPGWTAADELARAPRKRGSRDGVTPFGLLELHALPDDDRRWRENFNFIRSPGRAACLFREYVAKFHGRRQLVWSAGLRELLDIGTEVEDEMIEEEKPKDEVLMLTLLPSTWRKVCEKRLRAHLLEVASEGDVQKLKQWLIEQGILDKDYPGVGIIEGPARF